MPDPEPIVAAEPPGLTRVLDVLLVTLLLGLVLLLGAFPLKDTDFWWHLKTGDLIRAGAGFPTADTYTFGAEGRPWIDLHWFFEVLLSFGYEHIGIVGLNLTKAVITALAIGLLLLGRTRENRPLWVPVLAWVPAILLLSGRMYIRPETLSLLFLAVFLVILASWKTRPRWAWLLPVVQLLWVNTQGLFVLGPIVLGMAWVDAVCDRSLWHPQRRGWWRRMVLITVLTAAACLVNPYGVRGAVFPLELAGTMGNPVFTHSIAELMPVLSVFGDDGFSFAGQMGFRNLPLQLHMVCLALGLASFLLPLLWRMATAGVDLLRPASQAAEVQGSGKSRRRAKRDSATVPAAAQGPAPTWRLSPFALLLFAFFALLSLKATRNSHQFAAVAGAVTAWNLGDWAAAVQRRRLARGRQPLLPRWAGPLVASICLVVMITLVATGRFYAWTGEGRTVGLGEEPLWFPHEAVARAGGPGMPDRFVCFHNGHAALFEYAHAPARKAYVDARLEVIGPGLYQEYLDLQQAMASRQPGWWERLQTLGNPGILVDNVHATFAPLTATLMADSRYACVWYDPVACVFVPADRLPAAGTSVDFIGKALAGDARATDPVARLAQARTLYDLALLLVQRGQTSVAEGPILWGIQQAMSLLRAESSAVEPWKYAGLLESLRVPPGAPGISVPRFRLPLDPLLDWHAIRATHWLKQAQARAPEDVRVLLTQAVGFQMRGMNQAALPLYQKLAELDPPRQLRSVTRQTQALAGAEAARLEAELGPMPPLDWKNQDELARRVDALLESGRARTAAELMDAAGPAPARSWSQADRLATLWVHLGEPDRARAVWQNADAPPSPGLRAARVALTHWAEADHAAARLALNASLKEEPTLFEAWWLLAQVEFESGRAGPCGDALRRAAELAPSAAAQREANRWAELVRPHAGASDR